MKYSCQNISKLNLINLADTSFQKRHGHDRRVTSKIQKVSNSAGKKKLTNICPKEKEEERKSIE